ENVIFRRRTIGVGYMRPELMQTYSLSGPCIRAMGFARDGRRDEPYGIYDRFEFKIPTRTESDCFARYMIRCEEMEQSLSIVEQALSKIPSGPVMAEKVPKKIKPAKGEHYFAVESARGHFGMFIVSD